MKIIGINSFIIRYVTLLSCLIFGSVYAESEVQVAKQLQNPIADLVSVPFQLNYDQNIGSEDKGERWTLNIQPVIPIDLTDDWLLISRTILPIVWQDDIFTNSESQSSAGILPVSWQDDKISRSGSQSGTGDIVQSLFFSPKAPTKSGWIWGAGPVFLLPTGSDDLLTTDKWGAGPTGVALKQQGPWTYGALANHIWSFAGDDDRSDISSTFLQPFVSYTTPKAVSYTLLTESTYDWENDESSIPINAVISKVTNIGGQIVSIAGGIRYWAESPDGGPEDWGARVTVTFIFPKL